MRLHALSSQRVALPGVPVTSIVLAGLVVHLLSAWFNGGYLHPDEHFQILEFAWYKLGHVPASALAWEFPARMRPGLQPLMATAVIQGLGALGLFTPFAAAFVLRLISSVLGLWVSLALLERFVPSLDHRSSRLIAFYGSLFFWLAPCIHARFSSENWGGLLLFAGLCLALDAVRGPERAEGDAQGRRLVSAAGAGLLWSAAFYCRFQIAFALLGAGLWLLIVRKARPSVIVTLLVSALAGCAANMVVDRWLYGGWVLTPLNYFEQNVLLNRATAFGTSPWWTIAIPFLLVVIPPVSLAVLVLLLAGCWWCRRHVLVWTMVPFVVAHMLVPHKEARFMIPALYAGPLMVAFALDALPGRFGAPVRRWLQSFSGKMAVGVYAGANAVALLTLMMAPVNSRDVIYRFLWDESRGRPVTLRTLGASPYFDEKLEVAFYRPETVRVRQARGPTLDDRGSDSATAASFLFVEGPDCPAAAGSAVRWEAAARSLPLFLVRHHLVPASQAVWTVCRRSEP